MNSCNFIGRLATEPDLSYTPNTQTAVCRFTIAIDRDKRNGEDQGADFIRIVVYGKQAESSKKYLSKGRQVGITNAAVRTGSYDDRDTGKKIYTTEFVAGRVEFLGGGKSSAQGGAATQQQPQQQTFQDVPGASAGDFAADDGGFGDFFDDTP